MKSACCCWALTGAEEDVLAQLAGIGVQWVDIRPQDFAAKTSRRVMQRLGLSVSCLGLSFGIPQGIAVDSGDKDEANVALHHTLWGLEYAAEMGASTAYIIPGLDSSAEALARYGDMLTTLADRAATLGLALAIEHFPGRALPTIAGTLAYLRALNHPNLYLLLDIGHAQMSKEDIPTAIANAGDRLAYVHFDDNDGVGDLHWALGDGLLTHEALAATYRALRASGYTGAVSLELSPQLPDPLDAIRRSWDLMMMCQY